MEISGDPTIDFYLKLRNKLHFGQAKGTPFTIPPLEEEFDWAANSWYSKMVLEGTYSNLELSFLENKLLDHCKKERDADIIGKEISVEEWKDKIRVWRGKTTTSPSGKHLGYYKALLSRG